MKYKIHKYCPKWEKLRIKFQKQIREDWVGDWDIKKNKIMIHKDLKEVDRIGVIVHEFIEMVVTAMFGIPDCCDKHYKQGVHGEKNELAHHIANLVEKRILRMGGYSWKAHERRCKNIKNLEKRKLENE